jgi:hypothetical protein
MPESEGPFTSGTTLTEEEIADAVAGTMMGYEECCECHRYFPPANLINATTLAIFPDNEIPFKACGLCFDKIVKRGDAWPRE